jgi:hypothetical protein
LTPSPATILVLGVRHLPPTRISILLDHDTYYLDADIDGRDYTLGAYDNVSACAAAMVKWLRDRGLTTALGSARRLSEAHRLGANHVVFDVERAEHIVHQPAAYLRHTA